ncbi:MAG: M14 family metallopeptidase [Bacteroidia bacterium]
MIFRLILVLLVLPFFASSQNRKVYTQTPEYDQVISIFQELDRISPYAQMKAIGSTDVGKPLHLFVLSSDKKFSASEAKQKGKCVIMINNAIHPGEPDGIDACIELARKYVSTPSLLPENCVICIIPVFNVDGHLNRGKHSRANQNGPEEYGFRGNARNLDLNRDFVKSDAANTRTFQSIFTEWKPDIFIDTHVSDGADYQYVMTLIATQHNKLHPVLREYLDSTLVPDIYKGMKKRGQEICPYVETKGETPESGIVGFLETPRYSTGYAALFNCIGFVTESHMWKPYNDRVWATYEILEEIIQLADRDVARIVALHKKADEEVKKQRNYPVNWVLDTSKYDLIPFHGYTALHPVSSITGKPRLYYDRTQPYTINIRYYNYYKANDTILAPEMYIIPKAWHEVVDRLKLNGVMMRRLKKDTVIQTEMSFIQSFETVRNPYEAHYLHYQVSEKRFVAAVQYFKGDYVIELNQAANRFIVETLEPVCNDSYFCWNFFDGILNQKEWFSDYVFEEKAEIILKEQPQIRQQLDSAKAADKNLADSHWSQINFIYQRSIYKEPTHNRYPVGRIRKRVVLPLY